MILKYIKFAALYTLAALVVGTCALIAAFPYHPITIVGWIVWFLLALPIYVFWNRSLDGFSMLASGIGSTIRVRKYPLGESYSDSRLP
jgi:TM2 domain-containing membrane protein YozV